MTVDQHIRSRAVTCGHQENNNSNSNVSSARNHGSIGFELIKCAFGGCDATDTILSCRLRDQINSKSKELNQATTEISTLRSKVAAATKAIETLSKERDVNKERCLKLSGAPFHFACTTLATHSAAGELATAQRKLLDAGKDAQRLQREVATANLAADKAAAKLANAPKGPSFSEQVASLQASLKTSTAENQRLSAQVKALESCVRAKDKEIARLTERETWAKSAEGRSKALENSVLEHKREAEARAAEIAQLQRLLRQRDADAAAMQARVEAGERDLQDRSDCLAARQAELAMSQATVAELQTEVQVLRNEAARVGAVAARVAANDVRAGGKVGASVLDSCGWRRVEWLWVATFCVAACWMVVGGGVLDGGGWQHFGWRHFGWQHLGGNFLGGSIWVAAF